MKELKVVLSPYFFEDTFTDEVSGIVFRKGNGAEIHTINLEDEKLTGIQSALRKNILLPFNKESLDFVKENGFADLQKEVKEEVQQEVVAEEVEEETDEKPVEKKARNPRKKKEADTE